MRKSIGIEEVLNINDPNLWFYYIHGFDGYDISSPISNDIYDRDGSLLIPAGSSIIRSFKSIHKYRFGNLVKPKERSNKFDPTYEITNNNNERVCIRLSQLIHIAKSSPYAVAGYPRHANMVGLNCRNQRIFINKKLKSPQLDNTTRFYPKFNIIEDETSILEKNPNMIPIPSSVHIPIESIEGFKEYYGRKDLIIQWNE